MPSIEKNQMGLFACKSVWKAWQFKMQVIFCAFQQNSNAVAAHLRGMRPTPSTKKDTLMLRENSNFKTNT